MSPSDRLLCIWLKYGRYPWSRTRRRLFETKYLRTQLPSPGSLQDVVRLLGEVQWTRDGFLHMYDSISYPQRVWATKRDDCDGFAMLAAELMTRLDPTTSPVLVTTMLRPLRESHTVCVFRDAGGLRYFDNSRLDSNSYASYLEVAEKLKQRGHRLVCWDVVDPQTLTVREFHQDT